MLRALQLCEDAADSPESLKAHRNELWRATCNCAYWHGIFGGLYLPHLRDALYRHLIAGERALQENLNVAGGWQFWDVDLDGESEAIGRTNELQAFWRPSHGAALAELDYYPAKFNLVNTLRRYEEGYHSRVNKAGSASKAEGTSIHDTLAAKEEHLERYLHYDRHPRHCFLDHFIAPDVTLEQIVRSDYTELGDFHSGSWEVNQRDENTILFVRSGEVDSGRISVEKMVTLRGAELLVQYRIENTGEERIHAIFAPELNFSLLGGHAEDRYYRLDGEKPADYYLDSRDETSGVRQVDLMNEYDGFTVRFSAEKPLTIWRYPVETVSMSEAGFERVYQSSVLLPRLPMDLTPGASLEHPFKLGVSPADNDE